MAVANHAPSASWDRLPGREAGLSDCTPADRRIQTELGVLRGLFEAAVLALVVVDRGGVIVLVNAAAQALFGYRREELLGERLEILVPERLRAGHRRDCVLFTCATRSSASSSSCTTSR